ncbi:MAG: helix-turn-helix domain-containing protein, partial [Kiritimatiellia bacterium]
MNGKQKSDTTETLDMQHPLIRQIAELVAEATGERLLLVASDKVGWGHMYLDGPPLSTLPFCQLIQSSSAGSKRCRMCHILMAVSACSGGPMVQQCHAGASVMVCPVPGPTGETAAILSSCTFANKNAWDEVRQIGEKLGVDSSRLQEGFRKLPHPDVSKVKLLRLAIQAMSLAVQTVRQNNDLTTRYPQAQTRTETSVDLKRFFEETDWRNKHAEAQTGKEGVEKPLLVHVVSELVQQRSELPLTVKEIAAAARLTPNHFTTLFRQSTGVSFIEFLTEHRMTHAKELLLNPTLAISEIARRVGYEDPGYFTRLFRKKTRLSPRQWRNRQG